MTSTSSWDYFEKVFHPKSIAVIGPSEKRGYYWLRSLIAGNFGGTIFGVHPRVRSALGIRFYRTILDVPDPVDNAIVAVPAALVENAVRECVEKGVRWVTVFSSGFSESGPEGEKLERRLVEVVRGTNTRLNGPNCMGIYCPRGNVSFRTDLPMRDGNVGFVSQSGGIAIDTSLVLTKHELGFSKVVSVGNCADLDVADYVEYLANDVRTKVIGVYLESLGKTPQRARRLFEVLKRASAVKPVVAWKGGTSDRGAVAAASHTGAMKTDARVWDAVVRQTGVVPAASFEEFVDSLASFSLYGRKIPESNRVGVVSISGGLSVTHTDRLSELGLEVPALTEATARTILNDDMVQSVGVSAQNPIDLGSSYFALSVVDRVLHNLAADPNVDSVVVEVSNHYVYNVRVMAAFREFPDLFFSQMLRTLKSIRAKAKKPVFVALPVVAYEEEAIRDKREFLRAAFPVFPSVERAGRAIKKLLEYRRGRGQPPRTGS
ncbi:MAG: CoA-binding protein [Promethearchaeota archaeon]